MDEHARTGDRSGNGGIQLENDTIVNVAQLMKADVGEARKLTVDLDSFALDEDLRARDIHADLRLTRITRGILATGQVTGTAILECVRCLEAYEQPFETAFDEEYRPTIDVRSGLLVDQPQADEELGIIDDAHELDLAEPMRQVAILALPIKPVCGDDCPGPELAGATDDAKQAEIDRRLGVLSALLADDDASADIED